MPASTLHPVPITTSPPPKTDHLPVTELMKYKLANKPSGDEGRTGRAHYTPQAVHGLVRDDREKNTPESLRAMFPKKAGLGAYIHDPTAFPPSTIISCDASFVSIRDMYPKSLVHTLLLPRRPRMSKLHPFLALNNELFLRDVRRQAAVLKKSVAGELRRRLGRYSAKDALRERVLSGEQEWDVEVPLPGGRDWEAEVLVGVHAVPSMDHLHIHVLSRDMVGGAMKRRNHYMSFTTSFLVPLDDFPLAKDDPRRQGTGGVMEGDLVCWRCGKNFGKKFENLKRHLAEEFEEWKRE